MEKWISIFRLDDSIISRKSTSILYIYFTLHTRIAICTHHCKALWISAIKQNKSSLSHGGVYRKEIILSRLHTTALSERSHMQRDNRQSGARPPGFMRSKIVSAIESKRSREIVNGEEKIERRNRKKKHTRTHTGEVER